MYREKLKTEIKNRYRDYLVADKSGKGYICPICGSGTGDKGTGITTKDNVHFTCWTGCFTNSDIIDIIGLKYNLSDYNSKLKKAAELLNIPLEDNFSRQKNTHKPQEQEVDCTDFFLQAHKNIDKTDYHRGLSKETIDRFNIGYVENWKSPKAPEGAPSSPRLIIPTSKSSYLARDTRKNQEHYTKLKVGNIKILNIEALEKSQQPIFIVEGEIDALSIIDVGGEAVGLGSVSNINKVVEKLEQSRITQPFIIALDNDEAGEKASKKLKGELKRLKIVSYRPDVNTLFNGKKDANEAFMTDKESFTKSIADAILEAERIKQEDRAEYLQTSVAGCLQNFLDEIAESANKPPILTGFKELDSVLDGGLYSGLYIVGAISSLGKTTFCLQIADQIARQGQDVLIFSLEMARNELIAKSVSRLSFIEAIKENGNTYNAKPTRYILDGKKYVGYSQTEKELIQRSVEAYRQYAKNIYITEGMGNVGINEIREKVKEHVYRTGKFPVVVIDYLQIISPTDMRATDKQNTDKAVLELKRLSRDYRIPVIGISSFNRENYTAPVNLSSFKESGAIEYSSDVLIGLQYQGMDYEVGEKEAARNTRIRETIDLNKEKGRKGNSQTIQVKVLKNRNGQIDSATLDFYPMFNYFTDCVDKTEQDILSKYGEFKKV